MDQLPDAHLLELQGAAFASWAARDADPAVAQGLLERTRTTATFDDLSPADQRLLTLWVRDFQHGHTGYGPSAWASLDYGQEDEVRERLNLPDDEPVPFSEIPYTTPSGYDAAPTSAQADAVPTDLSGADFGAWVGL